MNSFLFILSIVLLWLITTILASHQPVATTKGVSNKKCIDKERRALLDFKARIQDSYGRLSTWSVEEDDALDDCCKWNGVTCDKQTSHVTKLDLSNNLVFAELNGEISPSLLNLTYLTHLDLSYNTFYGTIPTFIGSMSQIRYLDLGGNSFRGNIPGFISSMTQLRYLNLRRNRLNGTIPRIIGSMTQLRYLDLSYNFLLSGTIPIEFGNLINLRNLSLASLKNCTVENLDWLSRMSHLNYLELDGISLAKANHWVNVILSLRKLSYLSLRECNLSRLMHPYSSSLSVTSSSSSSNIVYLDLRYNNLTSSIYHWLFPLTSNSLGTLDLSSNMLDGIPRYFGNLCSLTLLDLSYNSLVVSFPDFLKNLSGCTSVTLQSLDASHNQLKGSFPNEIQAFSSLKYLSLSENQLNGTISENLWELPKLETLSLDSNSFKGSISQNIGNSKLTTINLSNNSLKGVPSKAQMSNLSDIEHIFLSYCNLGPDFPKWIQTLNNLTHLDISNTRIFDTVPMEFWKTWPSRLILMNLSSNNIKGNVPDLLSNFGPNFSRIDLSSNNFYGPILNVPSTIILLDLSRNKFSGGISFLCQIVDGLLQFLDLSHNSFTGQLPDCLWHFKELKVLSLGHNNLSGRLPVSIEYLTSLEVLYLYNNNFSGEVPLAVKNCTWLKVLNIGLNRFSGIVPVWIGDHLSRLYALSLRSNNFFGTIPSQLCQLVNLQILDLSLNMLDGTIPSCVNNLTTMVTERIVWQLNLHHYYYIPLHTSGYFSNEYADHVMINWQGNVREFSNNLVLLKSIDLSSNNLTGQIPYELTNLNHLLALNLSNNALLGEIPWKIGEMKELLTLDLSRNNFSGGIPSSMSQMTSLNYLDMSYNNLSGRIPSSTQLQSFEPSRYIGNAGLCGPPMTKYCPGDKELEVTPRDESEGGGEGIDEFERWFYIGGACGFATGFWIVCSAILLNRCVRHAFFHFLYSFKGWIYVKVMVFISNCKGATYA